MLTKEQIMDRFNKIHEDRIKFNKKERLASIKRSKKNRNKKRIPFGKLCFDKPQYN